MKACFTYEVVTPESAEQGDSADHGYWMWGGWHHSLVDDYEATLDAAKAGEFNWKGLRGIMRQALILGVYEGQLHDGGFSVRSVDPDVNYQTGAETFYTLHISGVTNSTRDRIASYLKSNGVQLND